MAHCTIIPSYRTRADSIPHGAKKLLMNFRQFRELVLTQNYEESGELIYRATIKVLPNFISLYFEKY